MHFRLFTIAVLLGWGQAVLAGHGREHVIPLFIPADAMATGAAGAQQGFLRIINHSDTSGMVEIYGYDDGGVMMGPAMLSMAANQTVHVNSDDLENGNEGKGLTGMLGDGMGNWRLTISSEEIDVEPLAYVRTKGDGLLFSVHDIASEAGRVHRVPIFNPGSNSNQQSSLRVINLGKTTANVTITGVDDMGAAGEASVSLSVDANGAVSRTAAEIESMGLGGGHGKWSLMVAADQPVQVMSLMGTPSGHLANLSSAKREYRGAAGLYEVTIGGVMGDDAEENKGIIVLLPDSRLYAWLPETMDETRIARGTYSSSGGMIEAEGVVYESGKIELDGLNVQGGADEVTVIAEYRSGDWIRGEYTVLGGEPRAFSGWAFTGFERGGSAAHIQGTWQPLDGDAADLPATFTTDAGGSFDDTIKLDAGGAIGEVTCDFSATVKAVNPAFGVYDADPVIDCNLLAFEEGKVELLMGVMDAMDAPGMGTRAIVFTIIPGNEEVALGARYKLTRQ